MASTDELQQTISEQEKKAQEAKRREEAFRRRGQSGAAERLSRQRQQAQQQAEPARARLAQLNPEAQLYSKEQLLINDRQVVAARLRAQSQAAAEQLAEGRRQAAAAGRRTPNKYEPGSRLDDIRFRSARLADQIEKGSGPLTNAERISIGTARFPDKKRSEIKSKFLPQGDPQRERAEEGLREKARLERKKEETGFEGTLSELAQQERKEEEAAKQNFRQAQRDIFITSGKSRDATPQQIKEAQNRLLQKGQAELIDPATGRPFKQAPGGLLISVRNQEEANKARLQQARRLAESGAANFQGADGRFYNVPPPQQTQVRPIQSNPDDPNKFGAEFISEATPPTFKILGFDTGFKVTPSGQLAAEAQQFQNVDYGRAAKTSFLATSVGVFEGASFPFRQPKEFVQGLVDIVVNPVETFKEVKSQFQQNPEGTAGQFLGSSLFFKGVAKATPEVVKTNTPRPTVEVLEIPQAEGTATVTAIGARAGSRGATLGTRVQTPTGTRYSFGRADLTEVFKNLPEGQDVKIAGPLQTSIVAETLARNPDATPRAQEVIPVAQQIIRQTQSTRAPVPDNPILITERLNEQGVGIILDVAKREQATVFGSLARRQTSDEFPLPRDVDVRLRDASPENVERVVTETFGRLQEAGFDVRRRADSPEAIEVRVEGGEFRKAVEFKGKNQVPGDEAPVPEEILGFQKEGQPINIGGQRFTSLNEELRGVTQGVVRVRNVDGTIDVAPPPKRVKDIGSLVTSAEVLRASQVIERPGLGANIQKIRDFYGFDVDTTSPPQILVADFSPSPASRSSSITPTSPTITNAETLRINERTSSPVNSSPTRSPGTRSPTSPGSPVSPKPAAILSPITLSPTPSSPRSSPTPKSPTLSSPGPTSQITSPTPGSPIPASPITSPPIASPPPGSPTRSPTPGSPTTSPPTSPPITSPPPITPTIPFDRTPQRKQTELFDVQVRRKGQFRTFNTQGLKLEQAAQYAEFAVDTSAARSFQILEANTGRPVSGKNRAALERIITPGKYRPSKKNRNIFVEKSAFAINTPGEKIEIRPKKSIFGGTGGKSPFGGRLKL